MRRAHVLWKCGYIDLRALGQHRCFTGDRVLPLQAAPLLSVRVDLMHVTRETPLCKSSDCMQHARVPTPL